MKKVFFLMLFLILILKTTSVDAQVTIGAMKPPKSGAVLDLSQGSGGLLLPRVLLDSISKFQLDAAVNLDSVKGMLIYNESKTTRGANSATGLFVWTGANWEAVSDGGNRMTVTTPNNIALSAYDGANDSGETVVVSINDPDCTMGGNYIFSLIGNNDNNVVPIANIDVATSLTPEFTLTFNENTTGIMRIALVQVINPCGKTSIFAFYQKPSVCVNIYNITKVIQLNNPACGNGAIYAYVDSVTDSDGAPVSESVADSLQYYWMLGNNQMATGRGAYLSQKGVYTVYADMLGCGQRGSTIVSASISGTAPAKPNLIAIPGSGIICGNSNPVKLNVLDVQSGEDVKWFKNGILIDSLTTKEITLSSIDFAGNWYAVIENNGCWSQPSNIQQIAYSIGVDALPEPQFKINDLDFDDPALISVCGGSSVNLEVQNLADYGNASSIVWYVNELEVGRGRNAVAQIPSNLTACIISVGISTTTGNCEVTSSTAELQVMQSNTQKPAITWQGMQTTQGVICRSAPAILAATISGEAKYQWFKNDDFVTPVYENDTTHIFDAKEIGTYKVRYQNSAGCWSPLSDPIQITQSAIPTIMWTIAPGSSEVFDTENTFQIIAAPQGTKYSWRLLRIADNGDKYEYRSDLFKITALGDASSMMITFPPKDSVYSDLKTDPYGMMYLDSLVLEVTAESSCGDGLSAKEFQLKDVCSPITSATLISSATKIKQNSIIQYTINVPTGSKPYYYQGYVYLENIAAISSKISWAGSAYSGKGALNFGDGSARDFWCLNSDKAEYPDGTGPGEYKKLLFVPWTTSNTFSFVTFAEGKHYVVAEVANDIGTLTIPAIPEDNGTYNSSHYGTGCTPWQSSVKSNVVGLEVTKDPTLISSGKPAGINYTVFMGGKSCLDVHQTGDAATKAWGANRLPLNVRPNDFSNANLVNGNYRFTYSFKGGYATIASAAYSGALTKDKTEWNKVLNSKRIEYIVDDPSNIVASVSGNGTENAIIDIKPSVIATATGKTRENAISFTLYAIYSVNGTNYYKDEVTISVQDAVCGCPAKMSNNNYILDLCHAAGADYASDPYGTSDRAYGAYYKWGNKNPAATFFDSNGHVQAVGGSTWDMESQNPCPFGWRVASLSELENIVRNNSYSRVGSGSDYRHLRGYIPIRTGGYRVGSTYDNNVGDIIYESYNTWTWGSNNDYSNQNYARFNYFYYLNGNNLVSFILKNYGLHVRCLQDGTNATYTP